MFGNSNSYNNIFGGIQESHQRMFGGDRMLATKDIEGAQPRKFHRHVWGNYQPSQYQNPLSYDPQKSTIKSPILGDNVQPLNRAIPNSSGLIFRDPTSQSLSQKMYTRPAQNYYNSAQLQVAQQTEPTPKMNEGSQLPYTAVNERKSAYNGQSFSNVMKDSKNQIYQAQSPSANFNANQFNEKLRVRKIEPPSQLREQNIFSLPSYSNRTEGNLVKPIVNVQQPIQGKVSKDNTNIREKMDQFKNNHNQVESSNMNIFNTSRSPDAYIPFDPTPKDYQRTSISSYALGQIQQDQALDKYGQQPCKSPVFRQNRNYGQDDVLTGPAQLENPQLTTTQSANLQSQQAQQYSQQQQQQQLQQYQQQQQLQQQQQQQQLQQQQSPNNQQMNMIRPSSNRPSSNRPLVDGQQQNANQQYQVRPLSNANKDNLMSGNNDIQLQQEQQRYEDKVISQSQILPQRPPSNALIEAARPQSNSQLLGKYSQSGLYAPQSAKQNQIQQSNDSQRLRSILSSRAKLLLSQPNVQQTANSEYGLYANFTNKQGEYVPIQKEKILYQSKRDNFLRSHLQRSQSAEGPRFNALGNPTGQEYNNNSNLKTPNQWGQKNYNIIGNYMQPYRYEGRKGDPFAEKKYLENQSGSQRKEISLKQNNYMGGDSNTQNINELQSDQDFRRSGKISSPIAGMQNQYSETNRKFNYLYHNQHANEQNQVQFFGAKALKNLSNIKLY